jgi:hypothetical protein
MSYDTSDPDLLIRRSGKIDTEDTLQATSVKRMERGERSWELSCEKPLTLYSAGAMLSCGL